MLCLAAGFATADAADSPPPQADPPRQAPLQYQTPAFEVTPFVGFDFGGSFKLDDGAGSDGAGSHVDVRDHGSFGLAFDMQADAANQYELFYGRDSAQLRSDSTFAPTNLVVEYLHVGGVLQFGEEPAVKPYLLGGLGATRFSPGAQGTTDTRFSASLGVGLRWPLSRHFSLRLEAREFATLVNGNSSVFCRSDQNGLLCQLHARGQGFFQGKLLAGAAFAF